MYTWKVIRTTCFILLLLPVVHLTYLVSRNTMETLDTSPQAWAREIEAYVATDSRAELPQKPIVVVGGLRVKLWENLNEHLAPAPVLMRGLGDAIIEDITFNYSRLIGFYRPDSVVLLPGNSEFYIRDSKSSEDLATAIAELIALDDSYGMTRRFYVFTPLKTPRRPQDHHKIDQVLPLLQALAAQDPRVDILDANMLLSDVDGKPRASYFRGDGVNLNEHGYLRLSMLLRAQMEADGATILQNTPPS